MKGQDRKFDGIFRYPGGKMKVSNRLRAYFSSHSEYREPFVGGGGLFWKSSPIPRWINDADPGVTAVYLALRDRPEDFISAFKAIPRPERCCPGSGKGRNHAYTWRRLSELYGQCLTEERLDLAFRFLFLNRVSWAGRVVFGDARRTPFTAPEGLLPILNSDRLERAAETLQRVKITQGDFQLVFEAEGEGVMIYADPPYMKDTLAKEAEKLYAHSFTMEDHERLAETIQRCPHNVLLSYDDDPKGMVRRLYKGFDIAEESWVYSGATTAHKRRGKELLIANYELIPAETVRVYAAPERLAAQSPFAANSANRSCSSTIANVS